MTEWQLLGLRLQAFIDHLNVTQRAVSKELEVEQGYFNQIVKGRKKISSTIILGLAKRYHHLDLRWLLLGEGEMISKDLTHGDQVHERDLPYGASIEDIVNGHERRLSALEKEVFKME